VGEPFNAATILSWALTILVAAGIGLWLLNREDL
jgi:hypothetical protein